MISHILDTSTSDEEKKLAIKIALASFVIFLTILLLIIGMSYLYQRNGEYQKFQIENQNLRGREIGQKILRETFTRIGGQKRPKGPGDIIVFDTEKQILQNDFVDLNVRDIEFLFALDATANRSIEFQEHTYLISRVDTDGSTIFLFHDLTQLRDLYLTLIGIALLGSIFALVIIYLLARYLAHITIEPIREQSRELEAYSHNVAHELRTPLAIMRTNLELLALRNDPKYIRSTDEEISGMERIIENLLLLAKPDGEIMHGDIDITSKTEEIITKYSSDCIIQLKTDKKHIHKKCSEELYSRVLCNIIENAIKYKSGGDIMIELKKTGIKISNQIDHDMSDVELSNITKVFYQSDISRNSTGYGLGLSLVTKIVEISGWTMHISCRERVFLVDIGF